jgi:hypothetical protein
MKKQKEFNTNYNEFKESLKNINTDKYNIYVSSSIEETPFLRDVEITSTLKKVNNEKGIDLVIMSVSNNCPLAKRYCSKNSIEIQRLGSSKTLDTFLQTLKFLKENPEKKKILNLTEKRYASELEGHFKKSGFETELVYKRDKKSY